MYDWPKRLLELIEAGTPCVAVTVAGVRGSAPRETGSKMLVTRDAVQGTIGGGQLEHTCIVAARERLADAESPAHALRRLALGSQCGQCCGGVVEVLFERIDARCDWIDSAYATLRAGARAALVTRNDGKRLLSAAAIDALSPLDATADATLTNPTTLRALRAAVATPGEASALRVQREMVLIESVGPPPLTVVLFGAGHVGRACATVLGTLDAAVFVIDSRPEQLQGDWPDNVTAAFIAEPAEFVAHCPPHSCYLIMTHDHGLDLELCREILARPDRRFTGLIGSASKRRRFEKRLRAAGYDEVSLDSLTCPIGIDDITGKQPGEIAVAVAAQLITLAQSEAGAIATPASTNVTALDAPRGHRTS